MFDIPTHFRNKSVLLVHKGLKIPHHFTLPFAPWIKGTVERLRKDLLPVLRSVVSEVQIPLEEWPDLLPFMQSALNHSPSPQRANVPSISVFTDMEPTPPISTFLRSETVKLMTLSHVQQERLLNIKHLQALVADLLPLVQENFRSNREPSRTVASRGTLPNFAEREFFLVAKNAFLPWKNSPFAVLDRDRS